MNIINIFNYFFSVRRFLNDYLSNTIKTEKGCGRYGDTKYIFLMYYLKIHKIRYNPIIILFGRRMDLKKKLCLAIGLEKETLF